MTHPVSGTQFYIPRVASVLSQSRIGFVHNDLPDRESVRNLALELCDDRRSDPVRLEACLRRFGGAERYLREMTVPGQNIQNTHAELAYRADTTIIKAAAQARLNQTTAVARTLRLGLLDARHFNRSTLTSEALNFADNRWYLGPREFADYQMLLLWLEAQQKTEAASIGLLLYDQFMESVVDQGIGVVKPEAPDAEDDIEVLECLESVDVETSGSLIAVIINMMNALDAVRFGAPKRDLDEQIKRAIVAMPDACDMTGSGGGIDPLGVLCWADTVLRLMPFVPDLAFVREYANQILRLQPNQFIPEGWPRAEALAKKYKNKQLTALMALVQREWELVTGNREYTSVRIVGKQRVFSIQPTQSRHKPPLGWYFADEQALVKQLMDRGWAQHLVSLNCLSDAFPRLLWQVFGSLYENQLPVLVKKRDRLCPV